MLYTRKNSNRLSSFDYSSPTFYFVTICTLKHECLFGEITNSKMQLNGAGQSVTVRSQELSRKFRGISLDSFICMPNHVHFLLNKNSNHTIPEIVAWFKVLTTNDYIRGVKHLSWKRFSGKLWQRNYYDHLVRNDVDLRRIREYIINNPAKWELDKYYPKC